MTKTLHELRTTGFSKLRPDRIHLRCDVCGRKQSNAPHGEFDPRSATLAEYPCDKCSAGLKNCEPTYFDKNGEQVYMCASCLSREAAFGDEYCAECRKQADDELAELENE